MVKITKQHYIIKLLEKLIPCGISEVQCGAIRANVQYPHNENGTFTITLTHNATHTGVVFNVLHNVFNTTIIQSTVDEYGGVWYNTHATINNKHLTAIWG